MAGQAGSGQSSGTPVWSLAFLQPLMTGALTPFSASVLTEMAGRSWYNVYDSVGFDPTPKSRVVRTIHGRPYFTLTLSAQLEAQHAGLEPPSICVAGAVRPLARWEKPGLLAGLKLGGNARKLAAVLPAIKNELDAAEPKGREWLQRVQAMHWSQAEILQIMEEIERVGAATLRYYVAARQSYEFSVLRLLALLNGPATTQAMASLRSALRMNGESVESTIARRMVELANSAEAEPAIHACLRLDNFADWENQLPAGLFVDGLRRLLEAYGHRCAGEGELMNPRWSEDPSPLLAALAAAIQDRTSLSPPEAAGEDAFLALVDGKRRKDALALLQHAREAAVLQSKALNVHAYTLAGTRIWALAAGREGMADHRLLAVNDVFFYELEETKQMMTGEWNVSDRQQIQTTAAERKLEWQRWQQTPSGALLIGDSLAYAPAGLEQPDVFTINELLAGAASRQGSVPVGR